MQVKLSNRQQQILRATVRHYVETAEPVGSRVLAAEYNLSVSPATVRNVMGMLEKSGLLYQPHTSAGRIPSDSGYRIYVDRLMMPSDALSAQVEQLLSDRLDWNSWSLEALLRGAAQILSNLSGYLTLITIPQPLTAVLKHLQLVQVDAQQVMLVVVLDSYETLSVLMQLPADDQDLDVDSEMMDRELQILSNFLNTHLQGCSLSQVATLNWSELDREFQQYADCLQQGVEELQRRSQPPTSTQLLVGGLAEVLRQPEFSESCQVQSLMELLERDPEQIWPLIFEDAGHATSTSPSAAASLDLDNRVMLLIGSENPLEPMQSCTLVSSVYRRGAVPVGSVGALGPTRMNYEKAVAVVGAAADYLSDAMSSSTA